MGWSISISAQFKICDLCNYPRDKNVNAFIESHSCSHSHPRIDMEMIKRTHSLSAKSRLNHLWAQRISDVSHLYHITNPVTHHPQKTEDQ